MRTHTHTHTHIYFCNDLVYSLKLSINVFPVGFFCDKRMFCFSFFDHAHLKQFVFFLLLLFFLVRVHTCVNGKSSTSFVVIDYQNDVLSLSLSLGFFFSCPLSRFSKIKERMPVLAKISFPKKHPNHSCY